MKSNIDYKSLCLYFLIFFFSNQISEAGHFPSPKLSPFYSDFLGLIHIDGIKASAGDEIAFFDQQDVLCGLYIVKTSGAYGIVHVYGDDPSTVNIDEGANEGDLLHIRVWDADNTIERQHFELKLSGGISQTGSNGTVSIIPPVWHHQGLFFLNIETKGHFGFPHSSSLECNFIGTISILGQPASVGDEIGVFDNNNVLCAHFWITHPGKYGIIHVYGDDPLTEDVDEGATEGETLTFKIWDKDKSIECEADHIQLTPGSPLGYFFPSDTPPVWTENGAFSLNIQSNFKFQSIQLYPQTLDVSAGNSFNLTALYNVSDSNNTLNGLAINIHFDSSVLEFLKFESMMNKDIFEVRSTPEDDSHNSDNNPETDKIVSISWNGSNWPDKALPSQLTSMKFLLKTDADPGMTCVNVSFSETSNTYEGSASNSLVFIENPPTTIHGQIRYSGDAKGTFYVGVWNNSSDKNWKTTSPVDIISVNSHGRYLMQLTPNQYLLAGYLDTDGEGGLEIVDIDPEEPYGFYTIHQDPSLQNNKPIFIHLQQGEIKEADFEIYERPIINHTKLEKHSFSENPKPDLFPDGEVLKAEISVSYSPGRHLIDSVFIEGPGIAYTSVLKDNGILPDIQKNDGVFTSWVNTNNAIGLEYTFSVVANSLFVTKKDTTKGASLDIPVIISPEELMSGEDFVFEWNEVPGASGGYVLNILETSEPSSISDYFFTKKDITETTYHLSENDPDLEDSKIYYYYITASDENENNMSYSKYQHFKIDATVPVVSNVQLNPSGVVKSGPLTLTITFNEQMNMQKNPIVNFENGNTFIGHYINALVWVGTTLITNGLNGVQTIHILSTKDLAGNQLVEDTSHKFSIDTIPPVVTTLNISPPSPVKEGKVIFTISFNENMNKDKNLTCFFNDDQYISGKFVNSNTWSGTYMITDGYDGYQSLTICDGVDQNGNAMNCDSKHSFVVDTTPPDKPTELIGTQKNFQIVLSWKSNTETDLAGYKIYRDARKLNSRLHMGTTYYDDILSGKKYVYTVVAVDRLGHESVFSNKFTIITQSTPPTIIFPKTGFSVEDAYINVKGSAEPGSTVEIVVNAVLQETVLSNNNGTFSMSDIQLLNGGNVIMAFSINAYGTKSKSSEPVTIIYYERVLPPDWLIATPGDTQIEIIWAEKTDVLGYNIYRNGHHLNHSVLTETKFCDTNLINGKTYYYHVTSVDHYHKESKRSDLEKCSPQPGLEWGP